jgi:hypothetical protein
MSCGDGTESFRRQVKVLADDPQVWIRLPKTVAAALEIDKATDTDFWRKAVNKEVAKVKIARKTSEGSKLQQARECETPELNGFQGIGYHIIFDVKIPSSMTYSSVVSRGSIRLAFLIAALNDLDIMSCYLGKRLP